MRELFQIELIISLDGLWATFLDERAALCWLLLTFTRLEGGSCSSTECTTLTLVDACAYGSRAGPKLPAAKLEMLWSRYLVFICSELYISCRSLE